MNKLCILLVGLCVSSLALAAQSDYHKVVTFNKSHVNGILKLDFYSMKNGKKVVYDYCKYTNNSCGVACRTHGIGTKFGYDIYKDGKLVKTGKMTLKPRTSRTVYLYVVKTKKGWNLKPATDYHRTGQFASLHKCPMFMVRVEGNR